MCTSHACGASTSHQYLVWCCSLHDLSHRKCKCLALQSSLAASGRACSSALQQVIVAGTPASARLVSLAHARDGPARMQPRRTGSSRAGSRVTITPAPAGQGRGLLRRPALRRIGCRSRSAVAERLLRWRSAAWGSSSLCARRLQAQVVTRGYNYQPQDQACKAANSQRRNALHQYNMHNSTLRPLMWHKPPAPAPAHGHPHRTWSGGGRARARSAAGTRRCPSAVSAGPAAGSSP